MYKLEDKKSYLERLSREIRILEKYSEDKEMIERFYKSKAELETDIKKLEKGND